jgi:hypothetical protein
MFVRHSDGTIKEIEDEESKIYEFKKPKDQPFWKGWLRKQGHDGWEVASEYTLNASTSVHVTLKRLIQ